MARLFTASAKLVTIVANTQSSPMRRRNSYERLASRVSAAPVVSPKPTSSSAIAHRRRQQYVASTECSCTANRMAQETMPRRIPTLRKIGTPREHSSLSRRKPAWPRPVRHTPYQQGGTVGVGSSRLSTRGHVPPFPYERPRRRLWMRQRSFRVTLLPVKPQAAFDPFATFRVQTTLASVQNL